MSERCIYCGMEIEDEGITKEIDGEKIKFCSRHCAVMFEGLGKKGRMKAVIMAERSEIISRLEEERGTRVITMIHRREPWEEEDEDYIKIEDTEHILMRLRQMPKDKDVDLILHTPGGLILAAEMIAMAVKNHPAKVTVIVPYYAMSGGTLIALAADEIIMEKDSVLGPVDPQLGDTPAVSLISLLDIKPVECISDENIMLADMAKKSVVRVKNLVEWLLEGRMEKEKVEKLSDFLTGGYITHSTPVTFDATKEFGLPIREGIPKQIYDLFKTFEFGSCLRPQYSRY